MELGSLVKSLIAKQRSNDEKFLVNTVSPKTKNEYEEVMRVQEIYNRLSNASYTTTTAIPKVAKKEIKVKSLSPNRTLGAISVKCPGINMGLVSYPLPCPNNIDHIGKEEKKDTKLMPIQASRNSNHKLVTSQRSKASLNLFRNVFGSKVFSNDENVDQLSARVRKLFEV